jgi:ABC-2 type transport system permease protein
MGPGARAVLDNANLVKKVAFAREILPLSAVGVGLVDFALQSAVLLIYIVVSGYGLHLPELALWPLAFVTLLVLTTALSLWFSAWNVRYRDVGHLLNIALLVWFWATPIVYAEYQVQHLASENDVGGAGALALYFLNPMVAIVPGSTGRSTAR